MVSGLILFPLFLLLAALAYGVMAQDFPDMGLQEGFGPGFFPTIVAAIVCLFSLVECARQLIERRSEPGVAPSGAARDFLSSFILAGCVGAAVLSMPFIGFVAASAALVLILSITMGMRPLWKSVLVSLLIAAALHLVFSQGFGVLFVF